ncbi:hypothetical protein TGAMA5MH_02214 [Trichoderma gamsii]|uniref:Uncharacterized protein n=1 Tax=Trichoderma gamsii TaxID=398673 RepID=A0A2K0TKX7_9HYPO|nr:hypothetical protein TGAMA5MH_02214 [Trichoderma gamsii]
MSGVQTPIGHKEEEEEEEEEDEIDYTDEEVDKK